MITTLSDVDTYLARLSEKNQTQLTRLETVAHALTILGNPQNSVPAIHIAGTSGKGSTAYYTANILRNSGYTVGLIVSPHVNFVSERSQVNGAVLPEADYCRYFTEFITVIEAENITLTYLEFLTTFSFWLFAELSLEYIVVEVGLGGRLDTTNVLNREDTVRVITDIGLDHTEILGNTVEEITSEKAGIIHNGNSVVMHKQAESIMQVVTAVAQTHNASLTVLDTNDPMASTLPVFQQRNWTLAKAVVTTRLRIDARDSLSETVLQKSLSTVIPGRFEVFTCDGVEVIIDAAHNPQKIQALATSFLNKYPDSKAVSVVAFGNNKEASLVECLETIHGISEQIFITEFPVIQSFNKHAIEPETIRTVLEKIGADKLSIEATAQEALRVAIREAKLKNLPVLVTGSFYLIDGIRKTLKDF